MATAIITTASTSDAVVTYGALTNSQSALSAPTTYLSKRFAVLERINASAATSTDMQLWSSSNGTSWSEVLGTTRLVGGTDYSSFLSMNHVTSSDGRYLYIAIRDAGGSVRIAHWDLYNETGVTISAAGPSIASGAKLWVAIRNDGDVVVAWDIEVASKTILNFAACTPGSGTWHPTYQYAPNLLFGTNTIMGLLLEPASGNVHCIWKSGFTVRHIAWRAANTFTARTNAVPSTSDLWWSLGNSNLYIEDDKIGFTTLDNYSSPGTYVVGSVVGTIVGEAITWQDNAAPGPGGWSDVLVPPEDGGDAADRVLQGGWGVIAGPNLRWWVFTVWEWQNYHPSSYYQYKIGRTTLTGLTTETTPPPNEVYYTAPFVGGSQWYEIFAMSPALIFDKTKVGLMWTEWGPGLLQTRVMYHEDDADPWTPVAVKRNFAFWGKGGSQPTQVNGAF